MLLHFIPISLISTDDVTSVVSPVHLRCYSLIEVCADRVQQKATVLEAITAQDKIMDIQMNWIGGIDLEIFVLCCDGLQHCDLLLHRTNFSQAVAAHMHRRTSEVIFIVDTRHMGMKWSSICTSHTEQKLLLKQDSSWEGGKKGNDVT